MAEPFIKLYKKMLKWEWYDEPNTKILFIHCLLRANWQETKWHGVTLHPGQFITSLPTLAKETKLSVRQVRVALDHLKMTGEVTDKSFNKFRIITVVKWDDYQSVDRQNDRQVTGKRQADDRQVTADKEYKEYKEYKKVKKYYDDEALNSAFSDYVDMREQIKKPMTDRAITLAQNKLEDLSGGDSSIAIEILNQSVLNGWQGLFPLKAESKSQEIDWSKV
jgi:hypothetical protein